MSAFRSYDIRVGFNYLVSRRLLAGLRDCPVTRGLKNTPPLAAVENIGQWTKVWTITTRRWKGFK